jgi:eukaryotic-like serine/threonine-protein kinase
MMRDDEIFAEALELPAAGRAAFLDRACAGDAGLRARVEALLASHEAARSYLERPVTERPPPAPGEEPGTVIGPYTLRQRIGEGGCGVVWLAEQTAPSAASWPSRLSSPAWTRAPSSPASKASARPSR